MNPFTPPLGLVYPTLYLLELDLLAPDHEERSESHVLIPFPYQRIGWVESLPYTFSNPHASHRYIPNPRTIGWRKLCPTSFSPKISSQ